ncbi:MAG TPA: hypothetical protein VFO94_11900, partial [Gammaproteobacteria bacterium]|nr:hypothetical protein [Gammaproteobacteria bacterium]
MLGDPLRERRPRVGLQLRVQENECSPAHGAAAGVDLLHLARSALENGADNHGGGGTELACELRAFEAGSRECRDALARDHVESRGAQFSTDVVATAFELCRHARPVAGVRLMQHHDAAQIECEARRVGRRGGRDDVGVAVVLRHRGRRKRLGSRRSRRRLGFHAAGRGKLRLLRDAPGDPRCRRSADHEHG